MFPTFSQAVLDPEEMPKGLWPKAIPLADDHIHILLVEDVPSDALLTRIALERTNIPFALSKIGRGDEVISRLCISQRICPSQVPDLIMLDLGLPGMDGFEILSEL